MHTSVGTCASVCACDFGLLRYYIYIFGCASMYLVRQKL